MHYMVFNSSLGLSPLDTSSITPSCENQKGLLTLPNIPWRAELSPVRTAAVYYRDLEVWLPEQQCWLNGRCRVGYVFVERERKQRGNRRMNSYKNYFMVFKIM